MTADVLRLDIGKLPLKLEVLEKGKLKNVYVIKSNKDKTSVFLNKFELIK